MGLRSWWKRRHRGPRDRDLALQEALVRVLDRNYDGAEQILRNMATQNSDLPQIHLALARLYRVKGEIGRAIRLHRNLLLRSDLDFEDRNVALRGIAQDYRQGGFLDRAVSAYEELLVVESQDSSAIRALIDLHTQMRNFSRAHDLQRKLSRITGREGSKAETAILLRLSDVERRAGDLDRAWKSVRRAVRRTPQSAEAWRALAELANKRGRPKKALAAWKKAAEYDSGIVGSLYPRISLAYAELGQSSEFEKFVRARLAIEPNDYIARIALARTLGGRGVTQEALDELRYVLDCEPAHLEAQACLARQLLMAGRRDEAMEALVRLLVLLESNEVGTQIEENE